MLIPNLLYSLNAVLPVLIVAVFGGLLKKYGKLGDGFVSTADFLVFKFALPTLLFIEVSECNIDEIDGRFIIFAVVSVTLVFICVSVMSALFIKDKTKTGAFVQGFCRSNFAVLGIPLAENMFGNKGTATISLLMPFVIVMFNLYSVVLLTVFSSDKTQKDNKIKYTLNLLKNIVTNPLIIAVVLALPLMVTKYTLPVIISKPLGYISGLATPLALISLGASFSIKSLKGRAFYSVTASIGKTVILPIICVTICALLGFRNEQLGVTLILFGSPSAVSSYIMAKQMGNDGELASQIMLLTTVLCIPTLFIGILILKTLNLI